MVVRVWQCMWALDRYTHGPSQLLTLSGKTKLEEGESGTSEITGPRQRPHCPGLKTALPMHTKEGSLCATSLSPFSWRQQSSPPRSKASFWQTSISGRRPTGSHHPSPRGSKTQLLLSPSPCQLILPYLF